MQKSKLFLPFVLMLLINNGKAQNLVPNGSFEVFDTCPLGNSEIYRALPWGNATLGGTPDYYNVCSSGMNVPYSFGFQLAINNGNGYVGEYGIELWSPQIVPNFREYIQVMFIDSLHFNHTYFVSFFVNLCDDCGYAINKMGAYLSDSAIYSNDSINLPLVPQIESNTFLSDTGNWMQISGYYQANGGEKFITIGNFRSDSLTGKLLLDSTLYPFAYYFIDSVTVIDCTATGINEQTINSLLQLAPNPASNYFTVKSQQNLVLQNISIYSLVGEKVMEQNASGYVSELIINVAALPKGIYIVSVKTNKGNGFKKFLKM